MGNLNVKPSARTPIQGYVRPEVASTGTKVSGWVDMRKFPGGILAIVGSGVVTSGGKLNAKLRQAKDGSGGSVKDIAGKAITEQEDQSDKLAVINCLQEDLDVNGEFTHVQLEITPSVQNVGLLGLVLGYSAAHGPAAPLAAVIETVG